MVIVRSHLDTRYLENVINGLPDPTYVEVGLEGAVNKVAGSELVELYKTLGFPDTRSNISVSTVATIPNFPRDMLLRLVKNGYRNQGVDVYPYLEKARWILDDRVRITLTRDNVTITYSGEEPLYVSEIRRSLVDLDTRLEIGRHQSLTSF